LHWKKIRLFKDNSDKPGFYQKPGLKPMQNFNPSSPQAPKNWSHFSNKQSKKHLKFNIYVK